MSKQRGILCAGTIGIDYIVFVDRWPSENSLSNIHRETMTGGGGPFNILKDLRAMDADLPLAIIGLLGNDDNGRWLINDCQASHIDVTQLHITEDKTPTSYSYVITVESTGRRTFFSRRGTNSLLSDIHFDFTHLINGRNSGLFYLGYVTLLNQLDRIIDNETVTSKVLLKAKKSGLETVVDFVSGPNPLYAQIAKLTLPYVDHLIINEIEAGFILEQPFQQATIVQIEQAARNLIEIYRVQQTVTIHFERGAVCVNRCADGSLECHIQGSLCLPSGVIKAAVGAGDAFAAGIIYGIHQQWSIQERLRCGICVAAMCLKDETPYAGVGTIDECLQLQNQFTFRTLESSSPLDIIES